MAYMVVFLRLTDAEKQLHTPFEFETQDFAPAWKEPI